MTVIAAWLRELHLEQYAEAFEAHDIDHAVLRHLTEADLQNIGVKSVGHRRKLYAAIAMLRGAQPTPRAESEAERRQLTVLYCELDRRDPVTPPLDPEDERVLSRLFGEACMRVVAEYGGHVANFYGDRTLAYFGWPRAHEDDPARAVRAGLALVQQVPALMHGLASAAAAPAYRLCGRAGIATGPVVVGDLVREGPARDQSAVGMAPNLGARVLDLGGPGDVMIDEATSRLLGSHFAQEPRGVHALKGVDDRVSVYAVAREHQGVSRFDGRKGATLAPMIGRGPELALLMARWGQACAGEGAAVVLVGEAGIGKSRLAQAVWDACMTQAHRRVHWQCSPYHSGSALWPVIQWLGGSAGTELHATLAMLDGSRQREAPATAPQLSRERALMLLADQLLGRSQPEQHQQRLLVVEDVHWIDPTTLELIERCLEQIERAPVLILMTSRPGAQHALQAHPNVEPLWLNRLGRASAEAIVARIGGGALRPQTLAGIVAQSDGVPLFAEELTRAMLETGEAAIPASLHGSLMARLDRIPEAKEVAQMAACIGRDFDRALLREVFDRPDVVDAALARLVDAELLIQHDRDNPRYTFKHGLLQEAAYQSILHGGRRTRHARIFHVLEATRPDTVPEMLALHAQRAGLTDAAIRYRHRAGNTALATSAYAEAAGHFDAAIELIGTGRDECSRRAQELELQVRLGIAHFAGSGVGAAQTKRAFDRAYELLGTKQDTVLRIPVLYGVWAGHSMRAECAQSLDFAHQLMKAVEGDADPALHMFAHRLLGTSLMCAGEVVTARGHLDQSLALYESTAREPIKAAGQAVHGTDAIDVTSFLHSGVSAYCTLAWTLAVQGFADQALATQRRGRLVGATVTQVSSQVYMRHLCALAAMCLRDSAAVDDDASTLAELAGARHLQMHQGLASCYLGWVALERHRPAAALRHYDEGLAKLAGSGTRNLAALFAAGRARALAARGRKREAIRSMEQAIADCEQTGQGWFAAELWRVYAGLMLGGPRPDHLRAIACLERALQIARLHNTKLWELRTAVDLASLHWVHDRVHEARDVLAPLCKSFSEGRAGADLREARSLLARIRRRRPTRIIARRACPRRSRQQGRLLRALRRPRPSHSAPE